MTDHDAVQDWSDVHALSGAYAIDALDDDERTRFEEHLQRCGDCRAEVAGFQETAALLGHDAEVAPPPRLRDQILGGIESIRPLPPIGSAPVVSDVPVPHDFHDTEDLDHADELAVRRRGRFTSLSQLSLVAAAVLVVALAAAALWLRPASDDAPQDLTATEQVLRADDARRVSDRLPDGTRVTIVVSRSEGRAVLLADDLAAAPKGKDYQLWLVTPKGDFEPAGLVSEGGDTAEILDGDASRATAVGITVEPDGGSLQPTTDPIAEFPLAT